MRKIVRFCAGAALLCPAAVLADGYVNFPLQPDMSRSQAAYWLQKPVSDSLVVDDFEQARYKWYNEGIGTIQVVDDHAYDGRKALRYRTSMRDSLHITAPRQRTAWGSFGGEQGGENGFGIRFETPQDWSAYNRISVWVYVHPDRNKHHHFFLYMANEGTNYSYPLEPRHDHCVQNLEEGKWQQVVWEIDYLDRRRVKEFRIFQTLVGYEPGGDEYVTIDFDRVELQRVNPDHYDGYQIPAGELAYSHIGYRPADRKVALAAAADVKDFSLTDDKGRTVFTAPVQSVVNRNGRFATLDFSRFTTPGNYRLHYGDAQSEWFPIGDRVWDVPYEAGLNYFYCQQCGVAVKGYHDVCHNDWFGFNGDEKKPMNGGFHDAGDLSQGYFRTAMAAYILLKNDEQQLARHAVDWIMKTRFKDGHHVSWARQRLWTDNREGTIDDVMIRTSNPAWENFMGAAALTLAATRLHGLSAAEKAEILTAAKDNWQQAYATQDAWTESTDKEASWGAISSSLLWQLTGDDAYKKAAVAFGDLLVKCQARQYIPGTRITGYFYTDTRQNRIVQNNHDAFHESPLVALRTLCETFPDAENSRQWRASAAIYADCFLKAGVPWAAPFDLLPNAVYRRADIERSGRPSAIEQYKQGWQISDDYCMRTFPIWGGDIFHGATCCNLSTAWALMEASQLRHDDDGLQLAREQLEWTLGRNPFGQSLMYGVGNRFATQFVYCSKDMVGGLPVGMDSFKDDAPYWHGSNYATSKETWIGTVNRFMGAVTALRQPSPRPCDAQVSIQKQTDGSWKVSIQAQGKHRLSVWTDNGKGSLKATSFKNSLTTTLTQSDIVSKDRPVVSVVSIDGKPLFDVVGTDL